jgi:hypothetical protein
MGGKEALSVIALLHPMIMIIVEVTSGMILALRLRTSLRQPASFASNLPSNQTNWVLRAGPASEILVLPGALADRLRQS